jgi:hypothetical protein
VGALLGTGGAEAVCGMAGGAAPAPIPGIGGLAMPPMGGPLGLLAISIAYQHPHCLYITHNLTSYQRCRPIICLRLLESFSLLNLCQESRIHFSIKQEKKKRDERKGLFLFFILPSTQLNTTIIIPFSSTAGISKCVMGF